MGSPSSASDPPASPTQSVDSFLQKIGPSNNNDDVDTGNNCSSSNPSSTSSSFTPKSIKAYLQPSGRKRGRQQQQQHQNHRPNQQNPHHRPYLFTRHSYLSTPVAIMYLLWLFLVLAGYLEFYLCHQAAPFPSLWDPTRIGGAGLQIQNVSSPGTRGSGRLSLLRSGSNSTANSTRHQPATTTGRLESDRRSSAAEDDYEEGTEQDGENVGPLLHIVHSRYGWLPSSCRSALGICE